MTKQQKKTLVPEVYLDAFQALTYWNRSSLVYHIYSGQFDMILKQSSIKNLKLSKHTRHLLRSAESQHFKKTFSCNQVNFTHEQAKAQSCELNNWCIWKYEITSYFSICTM